MVWLIPSLITGLAMALFTHSWLFLGLALVTAASGWFAQLLRSRGKLDGDVYLSPAGVAVGNRVLATSSFFWSPETKSKVLLAVQTHLAQQSAAHALEALADSGFRLSQTQPIEGLVGFCAKGQLRLNLASDGPHLFIAGPTGSGKSRWLEMYLSSLIQSHGNLDFWYADFKGGATLGRFASHPSTVGFTTDLASDTVFWQLLIDFLHDREQKFARMHISRIEQREPQLRRQIVVVDEVVPALRSSHLAATAIENIATRGRSLGIHLVVTSQGTGGLGRTLITNLRAKIALNGTDAVDLAQLGITQRFTSELVDGQSAGLLVTPSGTERFSFPLRFKQAELPAAQRRLSERRQRQR